MKRPRIRIPWRRITSGRALPWVLAVVFLATTLVNWWLLHEDNQDDARVAAVTDTATGFIHAFTNYNAQDIEHHRPKPRPLRQFAGDAQSAVERYARV